jgi:hypothetical protein
MNDVLAASLLLKCRGDEIWSRKVCVQEGVPEAWIEELFDCFESGFRYRGQTLFIEAGITNQFAGCRDLDLAFKFAEYLGVDTSTFRQTPYSPIKIVQLLQEELDEL